MARLLVFIFFCIGLAALFGLKSYKSLPVDNTAFNFALAEEAYHAKKAEIAEAERMRLERFKAPSLDLEELVDEAPIVVLDSPQLERGHDLYQSCIACHGRQGEGRSAQNSPKIGGQYEWYTSEQLTKMRDGERVNAVMMPFVRRLSDQDIADLSAYIAKLPINWTE